MPHHHHPAVSEEQRGVLRQLRDHDPRPDIRERCAAVLRVADGMLPGEVAAHGLLRPRDRDTVYRRLRWFQNAGVPGLTERRHGGPGLRCL